MCGIYGAVALDGGPLGSPERVAAMGALLAHRGPDARRIARRRDAVFGAERLRIVDLDPRADQPFECPLSGAWLSANGEIYNAAELRAAFSGYPWRSRSDVEPLLPLYLSAAEETEPEGWLPRLDGMFALAIWDEGRRRLVLARDRAGEKPLFYARRGSEIWFASEVRALLAVPGVARGVDEVALAHYLSLGYVLEPRTLFAGIQSVPAGAALVWEDGGERLVRYWDPAAIARDAAGDGGREIGPAEIARLQELLAAAVGKQAAAEVPVGVFLSGGIDSSLVAALAAESRGAGAIHTFTARFDAASYDESSPASRLAAALGTRHVEVPCGEAALGAALDQVLGRLATPLADPAILPTYLLARAASERVRVVLAGEGADELFGGYPTYLGHKVAPWLSGLPPALRRSLAAAVGRLPASGRKVTVEFLLKRLLAEAGKPWLDRHLAWFGSGLTGMSAGLGARAFERSIDEAALRHGSGYAPDPAAVGSEIGAAMLLDYSTYLRDDLLVKIDRATMLHSIEARAPFLDRDLQAFALALPERAKVRGLEGKWILKRAARAWLPRAIVHRRKRGLSVPVAAWINGGLAPEVDRLLAPERLDRQGLLAGAGVGRLLSEHRAGAANHARPLWAAFVLEAWLERWHPSVD